MPFTSTLAVDADGQQVTWYSTTSRTSYSTTIGAKESRMANRPQGDATYRQGFVLERTDNKGHKSWCNSSGNFLHDIERAYIHKRSLVTSSISCSLVHGYTYQLVKVTRVTYTANEVVFDWTGNQL